MRPFRLHYRDIPSSRPRGGRLRSSAYVHHRSS
jgi:hypothetical protein